MVDWEQSANTDFLLVSQFSVTGALCTCRPDLVSFVNGLALVVVELKKPGVPARTALDRSLSFSCLSRAASVAGPLITSRSESGSWS